MGYFIKRMERRIYQDYNCSDNRSGSSYLFFRVPKFILKDLAVDYMEYAVYSELAAKSV